MRAWLNHFDQQIRRFFLGLCLILLSQGAVAEITYHILPDGAKLRVGGWLSQQQPAKGTIVLFLGRASYLEKNFDFIQDLTKMGFDVESFDWPGHGGSDRRLPGSQKCHIDSFETYLKDVDHYLTHHVISQKKTPFYLIGVSMGGNLALRYVHDHPNVFAKMVLVVPMLDIITHPFPKFVVSPMVRFMISLGFQKSYAFGYGDVILTGPIRETSTETHDNVRHQETHRIMRRMPNLVTGGPTFGWVQAALESVTIADQPGYLQQISVPTLLQTAGEDHTVDTSHDQEKCARMAHCQHKLYPGSFHNITKEIDAIRTPFLQDIQLFLTKE